MTTTAAQDIDTLRRLHDIYIAAHVARVHAEADELRCKLELNLKYRQMHPDYAGLLTEALA